MTRHLRTARATLAGAVLATGSAALVTAIGYPGLCPIPLLSAYLLGYSGWRSYRDHRAVLVEHEQARQAALVDQPPRVLLTDAERAVFQQITDHYEDRNAA